jgi:hypothetical protein
MKKLLSLAALSLVIGFLASCNKDDENGNQLSKNEAQAKLNALNSEATNDLEDLANADGFSALRSLFDLTELDDPFAGRASNDKQKVRNYFRKKGNELRTIFIKKTAGSGRIQSDEPFDFNAHKGIYEWNFDTESFVKTGSSSIIEIRFPTEGSTTNNATLKITAYSEVELFDEEWEEIYFEPEVIQASLAVDGEEVASLDLNIDWDEEGFPLMADITVELVPFTGNLTFDVSGAMVSTVSASIFHNDDILLATSVTVTYDDASKSEESIETIVGYVQVRDVKLEGDVDVEAMDQSSDGDPNDYVHLALFADGTKLGDIVFEDEDGEWIPYIQYADGSKEKLEDVLEPILDELDNLESDFSDDNG